MNTRQIEKDLDQIKQSIPIVEKAFSKILKMIRDLEHDFEKNYAGSIRKAENLGIVNQGAIKKIQEDYKEIKSASGSVKKIKKYEKKIFEYSSKLDSFAETLNNYEGFIQGLNRLFGEMLGDLEVLDLKQTRIIAALTAFSSIILTFPNDEGFEKYLEGVRNLRKNRLEVEALYDQALKDFIRDNAVTPHSGTIDKDAFENIKDYLRTRLEDL
jgi:tetratricopeptide (TPR) repeat protein